MNLSFPKRSFRASTFHPHCAPILATVLGCPSSPSMYTALAPTSSPILMTSSSTSSPSLPPSRAALSSWSLTVASSPFQTSVGIYGGLLTTTSTSLSSLISPFLNLPRTPSAVSPTTPMYRPPLSNSGLNLLTLSIVNNLALSPGSTPYTFREGEEHRSDMPMHPVPVPTSRTVSSGRRDERDQSTNSSVSGLGTSTGSLQMISLKQ
mmetsp:Transcript_2605/g.4941  ORF Transcript_2605/g.4941 Transcript_2605/m.4941 type:complete len:207 (-) Transcript_2605:625-1245(-)